jgi:hypothetical protein
MDPSYPYIIFSRWSNRAILPLFARIFTSYDAHDLLHVPLCHHVPDLRFLGHSPGSSPLSCVFDVSFVQFDLVVFISFFLFFFGECCSHCTPPTLSCFLVQFHFISYIMHAFTLLTFCCSLAIHFTFPSDLSWSNRPNVSSVPGISSEWIRLHPTPVIIDPYLFSFLEPTVGYCTPIV